MSDIATTFAEVIVRVKLKVTWCYWLLVSQLHHCSTSRRPIKSPFTWLIRSINTGKYHQLTLHDSLCLRWYCEMSATVIFRTTFASVHLLLTRLLGWSHFQFPASCVIGQSGWNKANLFMKSRRNIDNSFQVLSGTCVGNQMSRRTPFSGLVPAFYVSYVLITVL